MKLLSLNKSGFIITTIGSGLLFLSSCGSKTDLNAETAATHLFAKTNPEMVLSISPRNLLDKSGMANGEVMPKAFEMLFSEMTDYVTKEAKTGLGFDGKSFAAFDLNDEGQFDHMYMVFNLKDAEKFASMLKEDMEVEATEHEGYNYVIAPEESIIIGWYKTFGIALAMDRRPSKEDVLKRLDELMKAAIDDEAEPADRYKKLLAETNDIAFLYDFSSVMRMAENESRGEDKATMAELREVYGDSYSIYSLNFETDKITAEIKNFMNEKADATFTKMFNKGINPSFMSFLTNDELIGCFTLALMPEPCLNFYKEISEEAYNEAERELSRETNLDLLDLSAGFSGEISMAMIDIKESEKTNTFINMDGVEESYTYTSSEPTFTTTIGLKGGLIKSILDTTKTFEKVENYYRIESDVFAAITEDKIFITNNESLAAEVGKNGKLKAYDKNGIASLASSNPSFGYFDFKALLNFVPEKDKDSRTMIELFDYAIATGNAKHFKAELYLTKSGKNSLYTMTAAVMNTFFAMTF